MRGLALITAAAVVAAAKVGGGADEKLFNAAAIMATVDTFHDALADGDAWVAIALLTPDAIITENRGVESRLEYAAKHLWEDIAFARTTSSAWLVANIRQERSAAWVTSNAKVTGSFQGKPVNNAVTEFMVLRKTGKGWRIQEIQWSSRVSK